MKTTTRNVLIGLVAGSAILMAGSVTIPNTFSANTTAKASEVNANFTAIETAVNSGSVVVGYSAFSAWLDRGDQCDLIHFPPVFRRSLTYFDTASLSDTCTASASVPIPEGADVTGMTCRYYHNIDGTLNITLNATYTYETDNYRTDVLLEIQKDGPSHEAAYKTASNHIVTPYTHTPSGYKSFNIIWDPPHTQTASSNEGILDCKVDYAY